MLHDSLQCTQKVLDVVPHLNLMQYWLLHEALALGVGLLDTPPSQVLPIAQHLLLLLLE